MLTGDSGDNLLARSPLKTAMGEFNPLWLFWQLLKLRHQFGSILPTPQAILTKIRALANPKDTSAIQDIYPKWLNPDFERQLNLKERWNNWWAWQPSSQNLRHPEVHKWLVFPDWNSATEQTSNIDFCPAEIRDPFLDLRLVEFVLSLPLLPWLYQKSLLRQGMSGDLPTEVIQRKKTALGAIHGILLQQKSSEWVDGWQPQPTLLDYVDYSAIPAITQNQTNAAESYIHLRPTILNLWLESSLPT